MSMPSTRTIVKGIQRKTVNKGFFKPCLNQKNEILEQCRGGGLKGQNSV